MEAKCVPAVPDQNQGEKKVCLKRQGPSLCGTLSWRQNRGNVVSIYQLNYFPKVILFGSQLIQQ